MQPPPPPPIPVTTVTCQWCSQPMNSADIRCTHCGKLRKDIYSDKIKSYVFCGVGGLGIAISLSLWKSNRNDLYNFETAPPDNTISIVLLVIGIIGAIIGTYFYIRASQKMKTWWWA